MSVLIILVCILGSTYRDIRVAVNIMERNEQTRKRFFTETRGLITNWQNFPAIFTSNV